MTKVAMFRLVALCLVLIVCLPAVAQGVSDDGGDAVRIAVAKFKTYCFETEAGCTTSQAAATCEKSGCYAKGDEHCYDCSFGTAAPTLDEFLAWLSENPGDEE